MSLVATQQVVEILPITDVTLPLADQPQHDDPPEPSRSLQGNSIDQRLAALASQHHMSDYCRLKCGPRGSPIKYVPLSIHVPDHYRQLREQQAYSNDTQAWWPCIQRPTPRSLQEMPNAVASNEPRLSAPYALNGLQEELLNAMSSPLTPQPRVFQTPAGDNSTAVKTSETHPINITSLIPMDLIPMISSHLMHTPRASPTLFEVPPPLQLHRLILCPPPSSATVEQPPLPSGTTRYHMLNHSDPSHPGTHKISSKLSPGSPFVPRQTGLVSFLWNQKIVKTSKAVVATTTSVGFKIPSLPSFPPSVPSYPLPSPPHSRSQDAGQASSRQAGRSNGRKLATSLLSVPGSKRKTPEIVRHDGSTDRQPPFKSVIVADVSLNVQDDPSIPSHEDVRTHSQPTLAPDPHTPCPPLQRSLSDPLPIPTTASQPATSHDSTKSTASPKPIRSSLKHTSKPQLLGNLLLSSCPGKKVRLSGPVNGRGGVCRDLRRDMQRFRDVGVECVVCCLDDEELEFLGAPWSEYIKTAGEVGLDVLRIPTPEGLAPLSVNLLDDHLEKLIHTYTLRGSPILVHCRGGVGRAGLVACCWAIKLGLFGWVEPSLTISMPNTSEEDALDPFLRDTSTDAQSTSRLPLPRESAIELVERVIASVRRRRSAKAVETYEQVRFLVEYVEYLHSRGTGVDRENHEHSHNGGAWAPEVRIGSVMEGDIRQSGER